MFSTNGMNVWASLSKHRKHNFEQYYMASLEKSFILYNNFSLSLSQYATSLLQMFRVDYRSLVPKMFGVKSTMDPSNFFWVVGHILDSEMKWELCRAFLKE